MNVLYHMLLQYYQGCYAPLFFLLSSFIIWMGLLHWNAKELHGAAVPSAQCLCFIISLYNGWAAPVGGEAANKRHEPNQARHKWQGGITVVSLVSCCLLVGVLWKCISVVTALQLLLYWFSLRLLRMTACLFSTKSNRGYLRGAMSLQLYVCYSRKFWRDTLIFF